MDTDALESSLLSYLQASQTAGAVLTEFHGIAISAFDIQSALAEQLGIPDNPPQRLLERNLTSTQIVELLRAFDFRKFHPEILAVITLEEPLVPSAVPRRLTERTVKIGGEVWRIHKNDADPFPSVPHAHNYDAGVVLDLGTGEMFDTRNRQLISNVGCKRLLRLRAELTAFTLPATDCK